MYKMDSGTVNGSNEWHNKTVNIASTSEETIPAEWKTIDLVYIISVITLGTVGNLIVIFSIIIDKKIHSAGNIFVINLAVADILICSLPLPATAATIAAGHRVLSYNSCQALGFILNTACVCSIANMTLIAVNRYCAVQKPGSYRQLFRKNSGIRLITLTWIYSIIVNLPTLLGWGRIVYDGKSLTCGWHDLASLSFAVFLMTITIFVPLLIITFCYCQVCRKVRSSGRWVRSLGKRHILVSSSSRGNSDATSRRSLKKERKLTITLLTATVVFFVCWTPYAIHVLIANKNINPQIKKFFVWLALTNSCLNFIIYGVLNSSFKKRYKKFLRYVFHCKTNSESNLV